MYTEFGPNIRTASIPAGPLSFMFSRFTSGPIRHGAMVCRIVNWKGLNAYSVTSPLNIWTNFLGHLVVHPQKDKILSYPLFILLSGPRRGGGGGYFEF